MDQQEHALRANRGLSVFRLKMIGLVLVTLGTLTSALAMRDVTNVRTAPLSTLTVIVVCEAVSWTAIPLYAWLAVTGFHKTSHLGRYMLRVLILALASEVPYDMATSHRFWDMGSQNPVWGVLASLIVLLAFRMVDPNPPDDTYRGRTFALGRPGACVVRIVVVLAALLWMWLGRVGLSLGFVNEGAILVAMAAIFDLLHRRENTMMYTAAALGAVLFLMPALGVMFLHYRNGKLGYEHKTTGMGFYLAYFLQLLLFGALGMVV